MGLPAMRHPRVPTRCDNRMYPPGATAACALPVRQPRVPTARLGRMLTGASCMGYHSPAVLQLRPLSSSNLTGFQSPTPQTITGQPTVNGGNLDRLPFVHVKKVVQTFYSKIQMVKRAVTEKCSAARPASWPPPGWSLFFHSHPWEQPRARAHDRCPQPAPQRNGWCVVSVNAAGGVRVAEWMAEFRLAGPLQLRYGISHSCARVKAGDTCGCVLLARVHSLH